MAEDAFSTNAEAQKNNPKTKFYPMKPIVLFTLAVNFQCYLKFPQDPVYSGLRAHRILRIDSRCKAIHLVQAQALNTIDMDTLKMRLQDGTCALMSQRNRSSPRTSFSEVISSCPCHQLSGTRRMITNFTQAPQSYVSEIRECKTQPAFNCACYLTELWMNMWTRSIW